MNEELNRTLAEWIGLEIHITDTPTDKPEMWEKHGTTLVNVGWIDFTESLDACFLRLMPKVKSKLDTKSTHTEYYKLLLIWSATIEDKVGGEALALCLAIEKLIDSEVPSASG